jgi:ABC-type phosphate/phosphonate transport system substrate-binding protein
MGLRVWVAVCAIATVFSWVGAIAHAAPLKLVIHDDASGDGESVTDASRYTPFKTTVEKAIGRAVELTTTRDRRRVAEMMERNQADVFITQGSDLAAMAMQSLGYNFIVASRPDINVIFFGKGAPIDNLKTLAGKAIAMPRVDTLAGQMCLAELRDFLGTQFTAQHSREYSSVIWAVENNLQPVGCIPSFAKAKDSLAAKGLKVLYEGRPVPAMPVVGALVLPAADRAAIAKVLSNLEEEGPGKSALRAIGVSTFTEGGETRLRALPVWLKAK